MTTGRRRVAGVTEACVPGQIMSDGVFRLAIAARDVAGWLLVGSIAYAPWATACTQPWAIRGLNLLMLAVAGLWATACIVSRRLPRVPGPVALATAALLAIGGWMTLNARSAYAFKAGRFVPVPQFVAGLPGSVDAASSAEALAAFVAFASALCVACDLAADVRWRRRLAVAAAVSCGAIAVAGILAKAGALPAMASQPRFEASVFATFNCHTVAGAYLNLGWPIAGALAIARWRRGDQIGAAAAAAVATCILAAAFINVSKAAQGIAALGIAVGGVWLAAKHARSMSLRRAVPIVLIVTVTIGLIATTAALVGRGAALERWRQAPALLNERNGRVAMWRVAAAVSADAGFWGAGPGTFKLLLPHARQGPLRRLYPAWIVRPHRPGEPVSMWSHAHNDYLQFLVEWGWPGAAAWLVLLLGGPATALRTLMRDRGRMPACDRMLLVGCALALVGVLLHALIDWPLHQLAVRHAVAILLGIAWAAPAVAAVAADDDVAARAAPDDVASPVPCASC